MLITHGTLGESLIQTAIHLLNGRPPRLKQIKPLDLIVTKAVSGGSEGVIRVPAFTLYQGGHAATGS